MHGRHDGMPHLMVQQPILPHDMLTVTPLLVLVAWQDAWKEQARGEMCLQVWIGGMARDLLS